TLAEIDGVRTLGEIAGGLARHASDVAMAVQALVAARVVEIAAGSRVTGRESSAQGVTGGRSPAAVSHQAVLDEASDALASGDVEGASRSADSFLARHPDSAPGNVLKGIVLARLGRTAEAVHLFDRAIEVDPLHEAAYFHLAAALVRRGDLGRARGALD